MTIGVIFLLKERKDWSSGAGLEPLNKEHQRFFGAVYVWRTHKTLEYFIGVLDFRKDDVEMTVVLSYCLNFMSEDQILIIIINKPELEWKPSNVWDDPPGCDSEPSYFSEQPPPRRRMLEIEVFFWNSQIRTWFVNSTWHCWSSSSALKK